MEDPTKATQGEQPGQKVPPREGDAFLAGASETQLWFAIEASEGRAVVGLKAPGGVRGVWRSDVLLEESELAEARDGVLAQRGVELLAEDPVLPALEVRVETPEAVSRLRSRDDVDYVEPANIPGVLGDGGCTGISRPWGGFVYGGPVDWLPPDDPSLPGDTVPYNYRFSRIQEAWAQGATGHGVTVGLLDTGIFRAQVQLIAHDQLEGGLFDMGRIRDRWVKQTYTFSSNPWDQCNHGTRMASNIAAPRDGRNLVGVAWGANLVSVKVGNDVVADGIEQFAVGAGIQAAVREGARIIAMAFGAPGPTYATQYIADQIGHYHYKKDKNEQVLFVGAAGTKVCVAGVVFPALLPQVVAATGLTAGGRLAKSACGGPEVDIGAVIEESRGGPEYACASGRYPDAPIMFGGSSAATALVAGVAALVWGADSTLTRDGVIDRLRKAGSRYPNHHPTIGYGLLDAPKALVAKGKEKERDKIPLKEIDKLGPKESDKLGPKETDKLGREEADLQWLQPQPDAWELAERIADVERRLDALQGESAPGRPFIRPEERPPVDDS